MSEARFRELLGYFAGYEISKYDAMQDCSVLAKHAISAAIQYAEEQKEASTYQAELLETLEMLMAFDGARGTYDASKAYEAKQRAEHILTKMRGDALATPTVKNAEPWFGTSDEARAISNGVAQGIAAHSDKTAQQAWPEGQEPGAEGMRP